MQFIDLRKAELGEGFTVGRALPTRERRLVGAWCFLDHLGPVDLRGHDGMHLDAHPHTCLQTFTWVMEGEILHRDSLGSDQIIRPGQVNLMTAGRGIAHTEDSLQGEQLHAAQLWIALPQEYADVDPAFDHYPDLPQWSQDGIDFTLLAGEFEGRRAPTRIYTPLVGLDLRASSATRASLPLGPDFEYGLLPMQGGMRINNVDIDQNRFAYLEAGGDTLDIELPDGGRCLLVGGEPFPGAISMWWNFVGHSREYISQAYLDWQAGAARFPDVPQARQRLDSPRPPWLPPETSAS